MEIGKKIDEALESECVPQEPVESNRNANAELYFEENRKLLEAFGKYHDEYRKDCVVTYATVADVAMRVPAIKQKWVSRMCRYKNALADTEKQLKASIDAEVESVRSKSKVELTRAAALKAAANSESKLVKVLKERVEILGRICDDLDQILKHVHFLNTEVSTIVDVVKLENA